MCCWCVVLSISSVCLSRGAHGRGGDAGSLGRRLVESRTFVGVRDKLSRKQRITSGRSRIKVRVKVRGEVSGRCQFRTSEAMRLESIQERSETSGPFAVWSGPPAPRFRFSDPRSACLRRIGLGLSALNSNSEWAGSRGNKRTRITLDSTIKPRAPF